MNEEEIIEKFKKCEVVDYLEDDYTTTLDWVKDGILDIIEKQQKQIEKLKADIKDYIESNNNWCDDSIRKSKVIDQMAQEIFIEYNPHFSTPEQVKEYFYKEIEND